MWVLFVFDGVLSVYYTHGDEDTLEDFEPVRVKTTRFGDARGRARVIQDYARVFFFSSSGTRAVEEGFARLIEKQSSNRVVKINRLTLE